MYARNTNDTHTHTHTHTLTHTVHPHRDMWTETFSSMHGSNGKPRVTHVQSCLYHKGYTARSLLSWGLNFMKEKLSNSFTIQREASLENFFRTYCQFVQFHRLYNAHGLHAKCVRKFSGDELLMLSLCASSSKSPLTISVNAPLEDCRTIQEPVLKAS